MALTPRDVAVLNVFPTQGFIDEEEFFVVYLKLLNAALESIKLACILRNLNICRDMAKEQFFKIYL